MQNNPRLAVHYDSAHPSEPWMVGVELGPGKLQVSDRYDTKIAADRVYARLLPVFRNHVARRIAEQSGKLAPVLPFRRVENRDHAADKRPRGSTDQGTSPPRSDP